MAESRVQPSAHERVEAEEEEEEEEEEEDGLQIQDAPFALRVQAFDPARGVGIFKGNFAKSEFDAFDRLEDVAFHPTSPRLDHPQLRCLDVFLARPQHMLSLSAALVLIPLLAFVALASLDPDFFAWRLDVSFYRLDDIARQRLDAFVTAKRGSGHPLGFGSSPAFTTQSVHTDHEGDELALQLVYVAKLGNVFDHDTLTQVKRLEDRLQAAPRLDEFCLLTAGDANRTCEQPVSALRTCKPGASTGCSSIFATPPGLLDCQSAECSALEVPLEEEFKEHKLGQFAALESSSGIHVWGPDTVPAAWEFLSSFPDAHFGAGGKVSRALRSKFRLALPLPGYASVADRTREQEDKVKEFAWSTLRPILEDEAGRSDNRFDVLWSGLGLARTALNEQVGRDNAFVGAAFAVFATALALGTKSWALALAATAQAVGLMLSAFVLTHRAFGEKYNGVYSVFTYLTSLAMAALSCFLWVDAWGRSAEASSERRERLSWTFFRSLRATTAQTVASLPAFALLTNSVFPVVRTQGLFLAMFTLVLWLHSALMFPGLLVLYDRHLHRARFCFGTASSLRERFRDSRREKGTRPSLVEPAEGPEHIRTQWLPFWVRTTLVEAIAAHSYVTSVVLICMALTLLVVGTKVKGNEHDNCVGSWCFKGHPDLLDPTTPYQRFYSTSEALFTRGGGAGNLELSVVFGVNASAPIARGDDPSNPDELGAVRWTTAPGSGLDLFSVFRCMVHLCASGEQAAGKVSLGKKDDAMGLGGEPVFPVRCWASAYCQYLETQGIAAPCEGVGQATFEQHFGAWLNSSAAVYSEFSPMLWYDNGTDGSGDDGDQQPRLRGTYASVRLVVPRGQVDYGTRLFSLWEGWVSTATSYDECAAFAGSLLHTTDSPGWDFFFLYSFVREEMVKLGAMAVVLSLVTLTLVSGNMIVGFWGSFVVMCVFMSAVGFATAVGWNLNTCTSISLVMSPAIAAAFVSVLAREYCSSVLTTSLGKVSDACEHGGVSVLKTCVTAIVTSSCMYGATTRAYVQQGGMFVILNFFVLLFALVLFSAILCVAGPTGNWGRLYVCLLLVPVETRQRAGLRGE